MPGAGMKSLRMEGMWSPRVAINWCGGVRTNMPRLNPLMHPVIPLAIVAPESDSCLILGDELLVRVMRLLPKHKRDNRQQAFWLIVSFMVPVRCNS